MLGAGLCFGVLYLRYRSQPKDGPRRTTKQKTKTAKILFAALLAWLTLSFTLRHMIGKIDGVDQEPSLVERVVAFLK
ncbi:MAG TPA: hypothetical protein VEU96_00955 [Bryobacteraceae bacterium]|nr:hypothetical protein [Bryobacteraceae bacterium]